MAYLKIENDRIPMGNFAFLYDYTNNKVTFFKIYDDRKEFKS